VTFIPPQRCVVMAIALIVALLPIVTTGLDDDAVRFPSSFSSSSGRGSSSTTSGSSPSGRGSSSSSSSSFLSMRFGEGNVSPCEAQSDFCIFPADYPEGVVPDKSLRDALLIKDKIFNTGFVDTSVNDIGTRFNRPGEKERACRVRRDVIYPRKARNVKGSFMFIMNQGEFRQAVEVEQCEDEGEECKTDGDAPSTGTTVCRQEFSTHRLYALGSNGQQVYDSFSLPSACLCHFRSNFGLKSAFGGGGGSVQKSSSRLPTCRAGINLSIPSQNQFSQGTKPPSPPLPVSQNFREPSNNRRPTKQPSFRNPTSFVRRPPPPVPQSFRNPVATTGTTSSQRRQDSG